MPNLIQFARGCGRPNHLTSLSRRLLNKTTAPCLPTLISSSRRLTKRKRRVRTTRTKEVVTNATEK